MWILVILILIMTSNSWAANPYKLGQVAYFSKENATSSDKNQKQEQIDWREPSPPEPMLALLENPTSQNAKAYLAWQKLKVQRILKAQTMIDQALKESK